MINRTEAWKCSDGSCYESKQEAYNAEIKILFQSLPKADKQPLALHLKKLIESMDRWLLLAYELNVRIKKSPEDKKLLVVKEFREMENRVREWLDSAKTLTKQMKDEKDVETARSIAGQGG